MKPNEAKNDISLLSSKCTLLTYVQLLVHQDPLVLFCTAAFQLGGLVPGVVPPHVQEFALLFDELHEVLVSPVHPFTASEGGSK